MGVCPNHDTVAAMIAAIAAKNQMIASPASSRLTDRCILIPPKLPPPYGAGGGDKQPCWTRRSYRRDLLALDCPVFGYSPVPVLSRCGAYSGWGGVNRSCTGQDA